MNYSLTCSSHFNYMMVPFSLKPTIVLPIVEIHPSFFPTLINGNRQNEIEQKRLFGDALSFDKTRNPPAMTHDTGQ